MIKKEDDYVIGEDVVENTFNSFEEAKNDLNERLSKLNYEEGGNFIDWYP